MILHPKEKDQNLEGSHKEDVKRRGVVWRGATRAITIGKVTAIPVFVAFLPQTTYM
ncbi:MAG: hypothetical protein ING02_05015 [Roseomonas sp.]|nr:hypothetical protein [Roseomonas sp.]